MGAGADVEDVGFVESGDEEMGALACGVVKNATLLISLIQREREREREA